MEQYFDREVASIERELTMLKTSVQKSSVAVRVASKTINISVPLSLNSSQTTATGRIFYKITTAKDAIVSHTLDWNCSDIMVDYQIPRVSRTLYSSEGYNDGVILRINAEGTQSGQNNDVQRLKSGESVSITAKLTVKCTAEFELELINE